VLMLRVIHARVVVLVLCDFLQLRVAAAKTNLEKFRARLVNQTAEESKVILALY
jgi:hypothetical protein